MHSRIFRETLCESGRCIDALKKRKRVLKKRGRVLKKRGSEEEAFCEGNRRWAASSEGVEWLLKKGGGCSKEPFGSL